MCVSPQNASVDDGRRECSILCTVFGIVWLSSLGREIGYLNLDILCFSSVHAKNRDFALNIYITTVSFYMLSNSLLTTHSTLFILIY